MGQIIMKITKTNLDGVIVIEPQVFSDERGFFMESYSQVKLDFLNVSFVQDNHSFSKFKNTLRGIHFQKGDSAQAKLVRCTRGEVLDVAVDLRPDSKTYAKWVSVVLTAENKKQLFIPRGFGHAFLTLTDNVEFLYKTDNYYNKGDDRSIIWSDKTINIDWQICDPILSEKDKSAKTLLEIDI